MRRNVSRMITFTLSQGTVPVLNHFRMAASTVSLWNGSARNGYIYTEVGKVLELSELFLKGGLTCSKSFFFNFNIIIYDLLKV